MKNQIKLLLCILSLSYTTSLFSQSNLVFSDPKLKELILKTGIDISQDNEIDSSEAELLDSLYIGRYDSVAFLTNLQPFKNLRTIEIQYGSPSMDVLLKGMENLLSFTAPRNINYQSFSFEDLPKLDSLSLNNSFFEELNISNVPNLKKFSIGGLRANNLKFINAPKLKNWSIPELSRNIELINVGRPAAGKLYLGYSSYSGATDKNSSVKIGSIDSLEILEFYMRDSMNIVIEQNSMLKEIIMDGTSSFDSLDLSSNHNLESFLWNWDNSRGYQENYSLGANYLNIKGLKKLKVFNKSCDFQLHELKYDSLPVLQVFNFSSVDHKYEFDGGLTPNLKELRLSSSVERVVIKNLDSLKIIDHYGGQSDTLSPTYFYIENCPSLHTIDFHTLFSIDSVTLINLPLLHTGTATHTFSFKYTSLKLVEGFRYLHFENIPAFDELYLWQGYGQEYKSDKFPEKLKTLILKDLSTHNEDAVKHLFNLEKMVIAGSSFKELDLSLLEKLKELDLEGNDSLTSTCVYDIDLANTSSAYTKDSINFWNGECGAASVSSAKSPASIYPNPTHGIIYFNEEIKYEVFDFLGNRIHVGNSSYLDLSQYSSGLYFVRINNLTHKVIKR